MLLIAASTLSAQSHSTATKKKKKPEPYAKHEIMPGYGILPPNRFNDHFGRNPNTGPVFASGTIGLTYKYYLNRYTTVGLATVFEYERYYWQRQSPRESLTSLTFAPEITIRYGESADHRFRYYLSFGIGVCWAKRVSGMLGPDRYISVDTSPTIHLSPFGLRFGHRLAGFAELGFGYKGLVNGGITYRLGKGQ